MKQEETFREALEKRAKFWDMPGRKVVFVDDAASLHEEHTRSLEQELDLERLARKSALENGSALSVHLMEAEREAADLRNWYCDEHHRQLRENPPEPCLECERELEVSGALVLVADLREKLAALEAKNKKLRDQIGYESEMELREMLESERAARREAERERDEAREQIEHGLGSFETFQAEWAKFRAGDVEQIKVLGARAERAEKTLRACAEKFREYERLHLAKSQPCNCCPGCDHCDGACEHDERIAKAEANAALAEMCEAALTPETPAEPARRTRSKLTRPKAGDPVPDLLGWVYNQHGEEIELAEDGACVDCGAPPSNCSPDDHK